MFESWLRADWCMYSLNQIYLQQTKYPMVDLQGWPNFVDQKPHTDQCLKSLQLEDRPDH